MILYYALGGGLGHAVRACKLAQHFNCLDNIKVLSACPWVTKLFTKNQLIQIPESLSRQPFEIHQTILGLLRSGKFDEFWVDTFPFGLLGELEIQQYEQYAELCYVARYVNWPKYGDKLKSVGAYKRVFIIDHLHEQQKSFIAERSQQQSTIELASSTFIPEGAQQGANNDDAQKEKHRFPGAWLLIHSGGVEELDELLAYAKDCAERDNNNPKWVVASQVQPTQKVDQFINEVPHNIDLASVEKIVSACGYNAMQELKPYQYKHLFMPFPRKYDDQFLRARKRRNEAI